MGFHLKEILHFLKANLNASFCSSVILESTGLKCAHIDLILVRTYTHVIIILCVLLNVCRIRAHPGRSQSRGSRATPALLQLGWTRSWAQPGQQQPWWVHFPSLGVPPKPGSRHVDEKLAHYSHCSQRSPVLIALARMG